MDKSEGGDGVFSGNVLCYEGNDGFQVGEGAGVKGGLVPELFEVGEEVWGGDRPGYSFITVVSAGVGVLEG